MRFFCACIFYSCIIYFSQIMTIKRVYPMKTYKYIYAFSILLCSFGANAQESYFQDELNAIRADLQILQRQIYRSSSKNTDVAPVTMQSAATGDVKQLGEYDQIIRDLNGKVDEMEHKISLLEKRIDTINTDFNARLNMIEGKPVKGIGTNSANSKKYDAPVAKDAPNFVTGGAVYGETLSPLRTSSEEVQTIYNAGLDAIHSQQYDVAAENFKTVTSQFPNDKLAGNAQYWLGEVYYAQQDYKNAAISFAEGYSKYKDSSKAGDNLLKLGLSMKGLNKKDEACTAFMNLPKEFPSASESLKDRAKEEASKLGCK